MMRHKSCKPIWLLTLCSLLLLVFVAPVSAAQEGELELQTFRAEVLSVERAEENPLGESGYESEAFYVELRVLNGRFSGQTISVFHVTGGNPAYDILVEPGDKVLIEAEVDEDQLVNVYIADHIRDTYVYLLVGLFVALVIIVGGKAGMRSLFGLVVTIILVSQVFLPLLLRGYSPLPLSVLLSIFAIVITMIVVAGWSRKTWAAILGTASGVLTAGILAYIFGNLSKLSGLSHEETQLLLYIPQGIEFNFKGLLFAGIVIGALGAVMDVGMSVASSMFEIKAVSPQISRGDLFRSGMNVGRDIMGTMTNTLILAYLGSSTPLLLLFYAYQISPERILNLDTIVTELVRAFSGSIGLISAIPLTALIATFLVGREEGSEETSKLNL